MVAPRYLLLAGIAAVIAEPAFAAGGAQVPEGSQFTLFALGLLGVLVGRRLSARRPGKDD